MCLVARRQNQITNPETIALTKIEFVSHPSNDGSGPRFSRLGACSEIVDLMTEKNASPLDRNRRVVRLSLLAMLVAVVIAALVH